MTLHRITAAATAVCAIIVLAGCPHPKPRHAASRRHVAETLGWSIDDFTAGKVRVLYKRSPGKKVVAVRIYFDGGTRNLTPVWVLSSHPYSLPTISPRSTMPSFRFSLLPPSALTRYLLLSLKYRRTRSPSAILIALVRA